MNIFTPEFLSLMPGDERVLVQQMSPASILDMLKHLKTPSTIISQKLGQQGEDWFENMIRAKLPECKVTRTSGHKWGGDFVLTKQFGSQEVSVMVDVKNYSNPVPREEISKFYRDMEVRRHNAGLILSLNTRFVGQPESEVMSINQVGLQSLGGRDANVILLTSQSDQLIAHCIRYLFSIVACEREILVNSVVVKNLKDVQQRLQQMSRLRYEIGILSSTITTGLGKLSNELLDIEVRTETLLDSIFANIDVKEYVATSIQEIETTIGESLRATTIKFINEVGKEMAVSEDKKSLKLKGGAIITRMATKDKISIQITDSSTLCHVPRGDFVFKKDVVTFDLDQSNLDLAIQLLK
jgi:hypothetical protein